MTPNVGANLQPLHFGPAQRRLFGLYHPPGRQLPARAAVLICNPFGQEAIRAQRVLRVLADRLARQGHAVLRFDYFGTGDSFGEDGDGDLVGWVNDVTVADNHLRGLSGSARTVWVGMRLGGTLAVLAARRASLRPSTVLAWDPIVDGRTYLEAMRERHLESLDTAFSVQRRPTARELAADPERFVDEALGFGVSATLRRQLTELTPASFETTMPLPITWVVEPDAVLGRIEAVAGPGFQGLQVQRVAHGTDWMADAAENTALVPAQAVNALVQLCASAS